MKLTEEYHAQLCYHLDEHGLIHKVYEEAEGVQWRSIRAFRITQRRTACDIDAKGHGFLPTERPVNCPLCRLALDDPYLLAVKDEEKELVTT